MTHIVATFSLKDMPDVLWALRHEMAAMLRDGASSEADPRVVRRLLDYATAFECGQPGVHEHGR